MSEKKLTLDQIRETLTGASLCVRFMSPYKAMSKAEIEKAAESLDADEGRVKGRKLIIDVKHPAWKALVKVKTRVRNWWDYRTMQIPGLEGVRVIPREKKADVQAEAEGFARELQAAAQALEDAREEIMAQAREEMGGMFDPTLYPQRFAQEFGVEFRERNIDPPQYLAHSNAEEYQRELERTLADVRGALSRFESECSTQLNMLASKLLSAVDGGRIFEAGLENFQQLFDRVAYMSFEGSEVFRQAMSRAKDALDGIGAEELRSSKGLRAEIKEEMQGILADLKGSVRAVEKSHPEPILASA